MSGQPIRCNLARCERRQQENPPVIRLDYARGDERLCLQCWREWVASSQFREGMGIPPDPTAIERWAGAVGGWR